MTQQVEAKRQIETVAGVSNVAFDLLAILENKLEGIAAMEEYKIDCEEAGDRAAMSLIDELQKRAIDDVQRIKSYVKDRL